MKLREFKSKQLAKLMEIKKQLTEKYPEKNERIRYIVDMLVHKLYNLRVYTLTDYLHTLYLATREFAEFEQLIPSPDEVEELLRSAE